MSEKKPTEATTISPEEQQKNQDKYEKQIDSMVFNSKKLISEEKFDEGIKILKEALEIVKGNPWGIMEFKISDLLDDVFSKHKIFLEKKRKEEEFEANKRKKLEEEKRAKETLGKLKQKENEEKQKKMEFLKAKKQLEEKNSNLAYQLIEKGSKLHLNNDFQGAIEAYSESKKLFSEINWVAEAAKMEDTLETIREQQRQYLAKLEHEKKEREKYEQELQKEKEMLKKVRESESNRIKSEDKKAKEDLESTKTKKELENIAFDKLDKANNAITKYDFKKAIDLLEEAKDLFIKTGWNAEVDKVQATIVKTKEQERQYLLKLEKDKQLQMKKQQEEQELTKKLEQEKIQREKEEKEKQERLLQEKNKEIREKQVSEHALHSIENIEKEVEIYKSKTSLRDFSMECPYARAKETYINARKMFLEIGWTIQAEKLLDSIKLYGDLELQDKKLREIERKKAEDKKKEQEEIEKQLELSRKLKDKEERERQEKLLLEKQKEAHAKEVSEKALEMIENIEKEVATYKEAISVRNFKLDCPYERAKSVYTQARQMFLDIGWTTQADKLLDSIKLYGDLSIQDKKLREIERKKQEEKQKEKEELEKQLELSRKLKDKEERERQEKLLLEKQKEARVKEVSEKALEMIENIEKEVAAYKEAISIRNFKLDCPYERAKFTYSEARQMFLEIGWTDQADKLIDSIKLYGDLAIQDKKLRETERKKEEEKQKEKEELERQLELSRKLKDKEERERQEKLLLEKQREARAKEVSQKALEMIENIEKEINSYKETISQKKLTIECPYERAKNVYYEARKMFLEIGWTDQADKLADSIKLYGDLAVQDKKWRDSEKLKEAQRIREENELKSQIEREKEQIEREKKRREEDQRKKDEEARKINNIQTQGLSLLEESNKLADQNKFDESLKKLEDALSLFREITWQQGIDAVFDSKARIVKMKQKYETSLVLEKSKKQDAEKAAKELEEKIKQSKTIEEKAKLEEQQKALERKLKKDKEEEEQAKIIDLLEQGSVLIKKNMFKEGLEKYESTLPIFNRISWDLKKAQVLDMIQTAKVSWEVYKKKQEAETEQSLRKKREIEEMEQKIKQEEEERKRKEKEEKEKFRLKQMEEQKLAETKDLAFSELDKANLASERKKYDKALESYNIALEKFKILGGWDKEVNMIMEKIEQVNKLIRAPLQAKESLSVKEANMSNEAYKELDEADKLVRLKKEEEALEHLRKARSMFLELKWDKAINMIEKRIEDTNALIEEKKIRLEKLKARQSQLTEEDAFKLLEEVDRDKKYKKYEDAIPKAKKAQDIFMNLGWSREATDLNAMIIELENELKSQKAALSEQEKNREVLIKKEEEEEERLRKIVEERRKQRREERKKL